jgi:thermopsin
MAVVVAAIALSSVALGAVFLVPGAHAAQSSSGQASSTLLPGPAPLSSAPPASVAGNAHQPVAPGPAAAAKLLAEARADHVDMQKFYPPNMVFAPTIRNGMVVHPGYSETPEPAGLADYGIMNSSGTPSSFTFNTTSYRASLTLNSLLPYYLATGTAEAFTSQLNVVLQNVTLFGNSSYNFWNQNVLFYDANSQQMFIENNIWNFSAPGAGQPTDTFFHTPGYTNGTDNPSIGYYAAGTQTFNGIAPPFSIVFYLNATTYTNGSTHYTEVDFSFNVLNGAGVQTMSDMYDRVLFNNSGGSGPIPQAQYHIDGTNLTPTGYIPYDAEIMLGGPGGGSTATFDALNASMTLQHWNATAGAYVNEPSAWSAGSETGETAVGVSDYYTASGVAVLGAGPEFVQPFWNSSATATAGAAVITGTISPSNSWAFVTAGATYSEATAAWAPLPPSGTYAWNLTSATYTVKLMESDYKQVVSSAMTVTNASATPYSVALTASSAAGVYTPLYAWTNSQLAAISSGGAGTVGSPYVLVNNEVTNLSGEFAAVNDYAFPAYPGISLVGTSAYVEILNPAPFTVDAWGVSLFFATYYDTPTTNSLSTWLFETSNVSIVGGTMSGWFSGNQDGFPYANLLIWNSTNTLVTGVDFEVSTNAIFTYGGTGNSIVGNTFTNAPLAGYNIMSPCGYAYLPAYAGIYCLPLGITGLVENEGGDSIWNNYFDVPVTAFETNANVFDDLYLSAVDYYSNSWNLSTAQPASTVTTINGISISGSTSGASTVCGNWWYNYLAGDSLPYNNPYPTYLIGLVGGAIITGGDYCPASGPSSGGTVVFAETGLPTGTTWSVTINGATLTGKSSAQVTSLSAGSYAYSVGSVSGYSAAPGSGTATIVATTTTTVDIAFSSTAPVTGTLSGTVTPSTATVSIDGSPATVAAGAFTMTVSVGTHSVLALATGYYPYYNNVTVTSGGTSTINIVMNLVTPPIGPDGTLTVTVSTTGATLWVAGTQVTLTSGVYTASEAPGTYAIEATLASYYSYYNNVTVTSSTTSSLSVSLNPVTPAPGPDGTLSVTVTTTGATLWVDGSQVALTNGLYSANLAPGTYSIEVQAANYYTAYNNITVSSSHTSSLTVTLNAVPSPAPASSNNNGISNTGWIIIGILAALAVIFLITTAIYMGRARSDSDGKNPPEESS